MFSWKSLLSRSESQIDKLHAQIHQKTNFFPDQRASEEVQLCIRTHWLQRARIFLWFFLLGILLPGTIYYLVAKVNLSREIWLVFGLIEIFYLLFAWAVTFVEFIKSEFTIVVVTNERVVDIAQKSIFDREITETNLDRIQEVAGQTHGIWRTFFDIGQVQIQTAGSDAPLLMNFVKSPQSTARKILDVQRASQSRRRTSDFSKRANDQIKKRSDEKFSEEELIKMRGESEPTRKSDSAL